MTEYLYIARVGRRFRAVWAADETAPYSVARGIAGSNNWNQLERACLSAYGVVPQAYGVTH